MDYEQFQKVVKAKWHTESFQFWQNGKTFSAASDRKIFGFPMVAVSLDSGVLWIAMMKLDKHMTLHRHGRTFEEATADFPSVYDTGDALMS